MDKEGRGVGGGGAGPEWSLHSGVHTVECLWQSKGLWITDGDELSVERTSGGLVGLKKRTGEKRGWGGAVWNGWEWRGPTVDGYRGRDPGGSWDAENSESDGSEALGWGVQRLEGNHARRAPDCKEV